MPVDSTKALKVWNRYTWARDNGHMAFSQKADKCEAFFRGDQWDPADKAKLRMQRRPALTINKILTTLANVMGEQIYNRSEISFRPRSGSPDKVAEALSKVFKQISDSTQLDWKRSDMFADGVITSRGFLDMRIDFDESMQGNIVFDNLNPKNVVIDPDATEYDPDKWNEVFHTKWMTVDDISVLYTKEDADLLKNRQESGTPFGYDSIVDRMRDRFGSPLTSSAAMSTLYGGPSGVGAAGVATGGGGMPTGLGSLYDEPGVSRNIRVIERQYRKLDNQKFFVATSGDMRPIPLDFDRNRIAMFVDQLGFTVIKKLVPRIYWDVVADDVSLYSDWSPYKHFTIVPYFPFFRHGRTIGLVENLIDPQELLNKVTSQELHIVNGTANSGYYVRAGALVGMSPEELETRGAETGIVITVQGEKSIAESIEKIKPNPVPSGLDRISNKAEESIKNISGVSDSAQGMDREDVAAKAIQAKRQAGQTNMAKPMDALVRTDYIIARNAVDLIQDFYTEERILDICNDRTTGQTEQLVINQVVQNNVGAYIKNDLTMGQYDVIISSVPQRETLEDSQFEQALSMKKEGVAIPDKVLIESSRLRDKKNILAQMDAATNTPQAQEQAALAIAQQRADVGKTEAELSQKNADAELKTAKAGVALKEAAQPPENDGGAALTKVHGELAQGQQELNHKKQMDYAAHAEDQRQNDVQNALDQEDMAQKREDKRAADALAAAQPQPTGASS